MAKILISRSVTYTDINTIKPVLRYRIPKKRLVVRKKHVRPTDPLAIARKKLTGIRSKIKRRLDIVTFRMGKPAHIAKNRMELNQLHQHYKRLKTQIEKMIQIRKQVRKK